MGSFIAFFLSLSLLCMKRAKKRPRHHTLSSLSPPPLSLSLCACVFNMERAKRRIRQHKAVHAGESSNSGNAKRGCSSGSGPRATPKMTLAGLREKDAYLETLGLKLGDLSPILRDADKEGVEHRSRKECSSCGHCAKNNRLYCFDCCLPMRRGSDRFIPRVALPLKLDVIRHPQEKKSKSTALHAKVVAGDDVRIFDKDDAPKDYDAERTLLIFPDKDSQLLTDVDNLEKYDRVVVLDCTWAKAGVMAALPGIQRLKKVHLNEYKTIFWRGQLCGDAFLATIEAIYYFFREFHEALSKNKEPYDGRFDGIMYLYVAMFKIVLRNFAERGGEERRLMRLEDKKRKRK